MKKFNLFKMLAVLIVLITSIPQMWASISGGVTVYLDLQSNHSNWLAKDGSGNTPRFAICVQKDGQSDQWASMTSTGGPSYTYYATIPSGTWDKMFICRMNGGNNSNNWSNKYNQSSMLTSLGAGNCYTMNSGWDDSGGNWNYISLSSKTVYFDIRNVTDWTTSYIRIGRTDYNAASSALSLVSGTKYLYSISALNWANYAAYSIANHTGSTGGSTIYQPTSSGSISKQTVFQNANIVTNVYIQPGSINNTESGCDYYTVTTQNSLPTYTVSYSTSGTGTGTLSVTKYNGSTYDAFSSGGSVNPTQIMKIVASPDDGNALSLSISGATRIGDTDTYYVTANTTITATFTPEETHDVTVSYKCGAMTIKNSTTESAVGVTTTRSVTAPSITGYHFVSWTLGSDVTSTNGTSTNPIIINTVHDGSDFTLTANYGVSSGWYLIGTDFGNAWNTSYTTNQFAGSYRGSTDIVYYPVASLGTNYWKVHDGANLYNTNSSSDQTLDLGEVKSLVTSNTNASKINSDQSNVWIVLDKRNSTKKLWVQEQQTYYNVNVTGANDAKGAVSVTLNSSSAFSYSDISELATTQFANGETFKVTVTGVSGWIPTITIGATDSTFWKEASSYSATGTMSTSDVSVSISYTASYAVTFATTTGGGTITATGPSSTDIATGDKVKSGTSITFTQTPTHSGYDFASWNSASTGDGSDLGGTSSGLTKTISAATTVYPIYTTHTYTGGVLDKKEGSEDGSYSVTYLATTMTPSAPTRTGYNVSGYYKETGRSTLIADASGNLQKSAGSYTDASNRWTYTSSIPTLYTGWTAKTYTADDNLDKNGGDSHGKYTATYDATSIAINTTPAKTGYHVEGYYDDDEYTNKVATDAGVLQASTDYTDESSHWTNDGNVTLYTKWTANTWYVRFNANGGSGSMDNESFTYDASAKALTSNAFSKTGYHFNGWNTEAGGGGTSYTDGQSVSNLTSTKDGIIDLYAQWAANTYSVVFNANGGSGSMSNESFTYDASAKALTTNTFTKDGYHFDGWATAADGDVDYTDGESVRNLTSTNSGTFNLYAHWTKSVLTGITFAPTSAAGQVRVTATPVITPAPTGTTQICWTMWSNSACTVEVDSATFTATGVNNAVTFWTPDLSGTYYIRAEYKTESSCDGGTELNTIVRTYVVASEHNVTIKYMYDGMEIASRTQEVIPAADSIEITAPDLDGYTFSSWSLSDVIVQAGADPKPALTSSEIEIKALYDGVVIANYSKKDMIYFNNTLGWEHVYVYFYSSDKYWSDTYGTGAKYDENFPYTDDEDVYHEDVKPHYQHYWGEMEQIEGTNVWRFDYQAAAATITPGNTEINGYTNVVFTKDPQGYGYGDGEIGYQWFHETEAVRRGDFDHGMSMFVPIKENEVEKNGTDYYFNGYWMNYPESSGYTLKVYYNKSGGDAIRSVPFEFNATSKLPSSVTVDLEAKKTYYFEVKSHHVSAKYYGNNGTMTNENNAQEWEFFSSDVSRCGITTTAAGDYKFNWSYANGTNGYQYHMEVDYPASVNDYRIKYTDTEHTGEGTSYARYSRVINKRANGVDTVSFFIAKGKTPTFAIEYITGITNEGVISWSPVAGKSVPTTAVDSSKVYNIRIEQDEDGVISSAAVIGAYEGNYYIRTDCASSQWNNYRYDPGNLMTYSEYAATKTGSDYTHYFMAHANAGTNVKFVVANDYSAYLTDTLYQSSYRGGDASHVTSSGSLNAEANIRFMWDMSDNKVIRAYLAAAKEDGSEFLVLQGTEDNILDENGNALSHDASKGSAGYNHQAPDNAIQFVDKENWMYETTVQVVPSSYVKLYAKYNDSTFYFYGSSGAFDEDHAIQLVTGSGSAQTVKVVYDFKTDRLVAAWQPPVSAIESPTPINADVMLVRNHQDAGQNIRFTESGELTDVKTVYGVMQFNRWTLNNRDGANDVDPDHCKTAALIAEYHPLLPANEMKSDYERFNYFISFPFDVKVGDIFGFGTYGRHWVLKYYDGKGRATNGYWADSESNWKYITNTDSVLHAYQGYLLKLSVSRMAYDNEEVWSNNSSIMELYFPSTGSIGSITQKNETIPALGAEYECTINRGTGTDGDRRVKDSYWRCIGVPSFADYSATLSDGSSTIEWTTGSTLPYLYEWIMETNHLQPQSTSSYSFEAMKAYLVQYAGQIIFSNVSAKNSVVARHRDASEISNAEWKLTLAKDDKVVDQAFVRLTDNENVTADFDFDQDLSKELNAGSNLYTLIGYEKAAANCMPFTEQTTIIPVGVVIAADGDYTFAIPEGTNGIGVTLIDNETGIRTSLSALDYTINLSAGTYNDRFVLEISPIQQMPTGVELLNGANGANGVHKVLIDGLLYIVKDGKMFDARGAVVK